MKTELESISSVQKKIKVEVPAEIVEACYTQALQKVQKKAKVKGFREGKVPLSIVEKNFSSEIAQETVEEVVRRTYPQALEQVQIQPISRPQVEPGLFDGRKGFSYTAVVEIRPDLVVKNHDGLKLEKEKIEVDSALVDEELKKLQRALTQLEPTSEATLLEEGHVATLDFQGQAGGKPVSGKEMQNYVAELGGGHLLQELEKTLKGMKKGEKKRVSFQYPPDYFNKDLAGRSADLHVTVKDIRKKNVPPLDDHFAKDLGNYESLAQVKSEIEKRLKTQKENEEKEKLYRKILEALIAENEFEVPESMVQTELSGMIETLRQELSHRGRKMEDLDMKKVIQTYLPEAEFKARSFLLLDTLAHQEKLEVSDAEVEQFIEQQSMQMKRPKEEVRTYYEKRKLLPSLKLRLLHEKALEFVFNHAKIKEVGSKK